MMDDALRLLFKIKQMDKIILVSDCLPYPIVHQRNLYLQMKKFILTAVKQLQPKGTLAGSTKLLSDIAKILGQKDLFSRQYISNSLRLS